MPGTLTIQIKSAGNALNDFGDSFKAIEAGQRVRRREGAYFTSIEAVWSLLTPNRLVLLHAIRTERPASAYALARMLGRDLKTVQQDLRALERHGLVRTNRERRQGGRRVKVLRTPFTEIALKIAI